MRLVLALLSLVAPIPVMATEPEVREIRVNHRHGQTFVTWSDAAAGEGGAKYRYSLYRSDRPITAQNLKQAELCYHGILNNSARLFGTAFNMKDRLDPKKPYCIIEEGGKPLPPWSGLAVHTVRKDGKAYYAVLATDEKHSPLSPIVPGKSATIEPLEEKIALIQPIKLYDSKARGITETITSTLPRRSWATAMACPEFSRSRSGVTRPATTCCCAFVKPSSIPAVRGRWRHSGSAIFACRNMRRTSNRAPIRSRNGVRSGSSIGSSRNTRLTPSV